MSLLEERKTDSYLQEKRGFLIIVTIFPEHSTVVESTGDNWFTEGKWPCKHWIRLTLGLLG